MGWVKRANQVLRDHHDVVCLGEIGSEEEG